ncbi:MAG: hypothetical protein GY765_31035, partial [bacterium]|nr:hypothetical protein [bacterium]
MLKILLVLLLLSLLSIPPARLFPREMNRYFDRITTTHGLSQSVVAAIHRDSRGFMWFGTQNGLNRFDGYTFRKLSENVVLSIFEDSAGTLWIGTEGDGLSRFNHKEENFTHFSYSNSTYPNPGLGINSVLDILEDDRGRLWLGTGNGLLIFSPKEESWNRISTETEAPRNLSNNSIRTLHKDKFGTLWIGTEGGLNTLNMETREVKHFLHNSEDAGSLSHNRVNAVFEDGKGNLWIGTNEGLDRFDRQNNQFIHYFNEPDRPDSLSHNTVKAICEDLEGSLWIGTLGGLNYLESVEEKSLVRFLNEPGHPHSLSHNNILVLMGDYTGAIWIGTFGGGLNRIDPQKQNFAHLFSAAGTSSDLSSNNVTSIFEDSGGELWIGAREGGLNKYNLESGKIETYRHNPEDPGSLSHNDVEAIYEDKEGDLWVGTWGSGINKFNKESHDFKHYKHIPGNNKGPGSNNIFCFCEDLKGNFWIGTYTGGLNMYLREKDRFRYFKNDPNNEETLSSNSITCIFPDWRDYNTLWIGTMEGFNSLNLKTERIQRHRISHKLVYSIYISPSRPETIWLGTIGGGLIRYDKRTKEFTAFTELQGLGSNMVNGILEDGNNKLWLSTAKGISRFNPDFGTFRNYDASDGLQNEEFNTGSSHKGKNGRFYFGGINGFNAFFPESITVNPYIPPVVITAFTKVMNDSKPVTLTSDIDKITLTYDDYSHFYIEFAALNYTASEKNRYAYKLTGRSKSDNWIPLNHKRELTYTSLQPGDYVFQVKGSNNDGVWNETGTSMRITILPLFWQTQWFRGLVIFLMMLMVFALYRYRVRNLKEQRKKLEKEVANRTRELEQSNREINQQKEIIVENNSQLQKINSEIENKNSQLEKTNYEIREKKDIIEEKKLQLEKSNSELQEAIASKAKLYSIVSHDVRNPLTTLIGEITLLDDFYEHMDDDKRQIKIRKVRRSTSTILDLLENLLAWARSQAGALKCIPEKLNMVELIAKTMAVLKLNADAKKIQLIFGVSDDIYAYADKRMIESVLRNLIANSLKFTFAGGTVEIAVTDQEDFVEISVIDSGVGISKENAKKLF